MKPLAIFLVVFGIGLMLAGASGFVAMAWLGHDLDRAAARATARLEIVR